MRLLRLKHAILAVLCLPVAARAQSAQVDITLSKAIEIALSENPTVRVADKDVELKKVADTEAWQALLPTADISANLQHTLLAAEMKLGTQKFKMGQDGTNTVAAQATLNVPLFAPAVYKNMKLTKEDIKLAQEKARGSRLDLVREVTKAYYAALLAKDSYATLKKSYEVAGENYDVVAKKYDVGSVSEYDKISADVQKRSMHSSMVSAQTGLTLSLLQLKVLMGITEDVTLNINDSLTAYEQKLTLAQAEGTDAELANNSALRQLDQNAVLLEQTEKVLKTSFLPTVAFQLSGQYQSLYNDNWRIWNYDFVPSSTFVLSVNVPLYHASNFTKLKTNRLQREQLALTRENTRRQLSVAAESYKRNMRSTIAQVESNREAVSQARKAVSISSKRYEVGRGTVLELNQSETALTQAELTYCQSIYDFLANKADLDYTLGR